MSEPAETAGSGSSGSSGAGGVVRAMFEIEHPAGAAPAHNPGQRARRVLLKANRAILSLELVIYVCFLVTLAVVGSSELGGTRLIFMRRFLEFQLVQSEYQVHPPAVLSNVRDLVNFQMYMTGLIGPLAGDHTRLLNLDAASGQPVDADAVDCEAGVSVSSDLLMQFYSEHPTIKTYEQEALQGWSLRQVRKTSAFSAEYEKATVATEAPAYWPSQFPENLADCGCGNPFEYQTANTVFGMGMYAEFKGRADTYPGGGFVHTMRGNPYNVTGSSCVQDRLAYMFANDWVDQDTTAVFLDACIGSYYGDAAAGTYEADAGVTNDQICVRVLFEFGEFGDVTPTYYIRGADPGVISGQLETVFYSFAAIFLCFELVQLGAAYVAHRPSWKGVVHAYFNEHAAPIWKTVDLLLLLLLFLGSASVSLQTGDQSTYMELELAEYFRAVYAFTICLTVLSACKFLSWFPLLHLPVMALYNSISNLLAFSAFLFITNAGLAALAFYVWGPVFEDFRTFPRSMLTLLQATLGEFGFDRFEGAQYEWVGTVAMCIYGYVSVFILLSMFIVIVEKGFEEAEHEAKQESKVKMRRLKSNLHKMRLGAKMAGATHRHASHKHIDEELEAAEVDALNDAIQSAVEQFLQTREKRRRRSAAKAAVAHLTHHRSGSMDSSGDEGGSSKPAAGLAGLVSAVAAQSASTEEVEVEDIEGAGAGEEEEAPAAVGAGSADDGTAGARV